MIQVSDSTDIDIENSSSDSINTSDLETTSYLENEEYNINSEEEDMI